MTRRHLGCCWVTVLAALAGCGDSEKAGDQAGKATGSSAADTGKRCERLAKLCGDKAKHVEKITETCTQAMKQQGERGCLDQQLAVYDCFEQELCMTLTDKVWSIEDLGVLADRHKKCATERAALASCGKKN